MRPMVAVEMLAQRGIQGVLDQRAFPRARYTRDGDERPQGQAYVDMFQIMFTRSSYAQPGALLHRALATSLTLVPAITHIAPGERVRMPGQPLAACQRPPHSPLGASAGTEIDDMIRPADGLLIVFHHDNAVAVGLQTVQGPQQPRIVARVQAMGNVEIAEALFEAIAGRNDRGVRSLCASNVRTRQNNGAEMDLEAFLALSNAVQAVVRDFRYADAVRSATATGFVEEHAVRGTLPDGQTIDIAACVVADVRDGKITDIREYLDTAAAANLIAALGSTKERPPK